MPAIGAVFTTTHVYGINDSELARGGCCRSAVCTGGGAWARETVWVGAGCKGQQGDAKWPPFDIRTAWHERGHAEANLRSEQYALARQSTATFSHLIAKVNDRHPVTHGPSPLPRRPRGRNRRPEGRESSLTTLVPCTEAASNPSDSELRVYLACSVLRAQQTPRHTSGTLVWHCSMCQHTRVARRSTVCTSKV